MKKSEYKALIAVLLAENSRLKEAKKAEEKPVFKSFNERFLYAFKALNEAKQSIPRKIGKKGIYYKDNIYTFDGYEEYQGEIVDVVEGDGVLFFYINDKFISFSHLQAENNSRHKTFAQKIQEKEDYRDMQEERKNTRESRKKLYASVEDFFKAMNKAKSN
ncbi:MAG: hypothetical protein NTW78_05850 [Campylobacterales bacterium]|nr:hypothetical protein [Campylobacterales bacterium]